MSFRELRNFKEIMATMGYPRLISIENFKVPHFELVADALEWLCHRYDKNMEILSDIRTEQDRVAFLKSVAEQLLVKARVKLNLKNLYASNGFAVRELLKVATLLHDAHKNASLDQEEAEEAMTVDIGPGLWPLHGTPTLTLTLTLTLTPHLSLSPSPDAPPQPWPGHKFADIKLTRTLSQDITKYGSRLYELLGAHAERQRRWPYPYPYPYP